MQVKNFPKGEFFLPFFLCFPKRRKNSRQGHRRKAEKTAACGGKRIKLDCAKWLFCALIRGLQNLEASLKGFNCCGAKLRLRWAESRFEKPRSFLQRGRFYVLFASCKKNQKARQRFANLWTPGTIQSSAESEFAKTSGGFCRNRFCLQNAGVKALNRCERIAVEQTQDRCFSKKNCCTASLQRQVLFKKGCCALALARWEVGVVVR